MRALLVAGGAPSPSLPRLLAEDFDLVVAVDAGADTLLHHDRLPHALLGDLDSVKPDTVATLEAARVHVERHPAAKRDTDLTLGIDWVLDRGVDDVVLAGVTGSRLDHALAAFHVLHRLASAGVRVRLEDADARVHAVGPATPIALEGVEAGTRVSVLPLMGGAEGVTLSNVRYSLDDATMDAGDPFGVSNEASGGTVRVSVRRGVLAVVLPERTSG